MKIPIKIQENQIESGKFYVSCEFDNIVDKNCHLDTGSTYTSVMWTPEIGTYPITGTKIRSSASGKEVEEEKITFDTFGFGENIKRDFEVVRYKKERNQESRVGMSFFSESILSFNFKDRHLEIFKEMEKSLENHLHVDSKGLFYINIKFEKSDYQALWDTGAELTVVSPNLVESNKKNFDFIMDIPGGSDATGNKIFFKLFKSKSLELNGVTLEGNVLSMDFTPLRKKISDDVDVILGFNHIRQLNWILDLKNKMWTSSIKEDE